MLYNTPLHWAAFHGNLNIVRYLVNQKADINAKNYIMNNFWIKSTFLLCKTFLLCINLFSHFSRDRNKIDFSHFDYM